MSNISKSQSALQLVPFNSTFGDNSSLKDFYFDENGGYLGSSEILEQFTHIQIKNLTGNINVRFKIPGTSAIIALKVNTNANFLLIQRSTAYVEIIKLSDLKNLQMFCVPCVKVHDQIKSAYWAGNNALIFVTYKQIEIHKICCDCTASELLSSYSLKVSWDIFLPSCNLLLVAYDYNAMSLKAFFIAKFVPITDFSMHLKPTSKAHHILNKNDVFLCQLYSVPYLAIFGFFCEYAHLYIVDGLREKSFIHKYSLSLIGDLSHISFSVVDNILVLHDRTLQSSLIYDINDSQFENSLGAFKCNPVFNDGLILYCSDSNTFPKCDDSIKNSSSSLAQDSANIYTDTISIIYPDYVIDSINGYIYQLSLHLEAIPALFKDNYFRAINFLYSRTDGKQFLLGYLAKIFMQKITSISIIERIFKTIVLYYQTYHARQNNFKDMLQDKSIHLFFTFCIEQIDVYSSLILPLINSNKDFSKSQTIYHLQYCECVIMTYITCLKKRKIGIISLLSQSLTDILIRLGKIYQLEQLLNSDLFTYDRDFILYLVKLSKRYPSVSHTVMNICLTHDCLDGLFECIVYTNKPNLIPFYFNALNKTRLYHQDTHELSENIISSLKIDKLFEISSSHPNEVFFTATDIESIMTILKTVSIKNN